MLKTLRTLLSLTYRAVARPEDRFLGEAGRRVASLLVFAFVGSVTFFLASSAGRAGLAATAGWVAASACYLYFSWRFVLGGSPELTRAWALAQDAPRSRVLRGVFGRAVGLGVVVLATVAGLLTATGLTQEGGDGLLRVLSGLGVIGSWLVLHTAYGLHYAYLHYGDGPEGGLEFPGDEDPGLVDFCYFALAVATAFAVSDVRVTSTRIRRVVIGHSLLSFAYNAAILTLAFGAVLGVALG